MPRIDIRSSAAFNSDRNVAANGVLFANEIKAAAVDGAQALPPPFVRAFINAVIDKNFAPQQQEACKNFLDYLHEFDGRSPAWMRDRKNADLDYLSWTMRQIEENYGKICATCRRAVRALSSEAKLAAYLQKNPAVKRALQAARFNAEDELDRLQKNGALNIDVFPYARDCLQDRLQVKFIDTLRRKWDLTDPSGFQGKCQN